MATLGRNRLLALSAFLLLILWGPSVLANHLVGGELSYQCLGNNQYQVKLRIYRDCNSTGAALDPQADLSVFDGVSGVLLSNHLVQKGPTLTLPLNTGNPCLQAPPNICTEYADYIITLSLPPRPGGYVLTHQRCCRNSTITNIGNPSLRGSTFSVQIPPNDVGCNSSPVFTVIPPIVLCNDEFLSLSSAATDADGDSIHYELCKLYNGGGQTSGSNCLTCPAPSPAAAPPYIAIPFLSPLSFLNPIPGAPGLSIHPTTGILTGFLTATGQYSLGICASEYRNGVLLSTVRRDYQFNVTPCDLSVWADIVTESENPTLLCLGTTVPFSQTSHNTTTFHWDFGVQGTLTDTSNQPNPVYTFPDTGIYKVMLIANPGYACADTDFAYFHVYPPIHAGVGFSGNLCEDIQGLIFNGTGTWYPGSLLQFTFGSPGDANINGWSGAFPPPITFSGPGKFPVSFYVKSKACEETVWDTVTIYPRPALTLVSVADTGCQPFTVQFSQDSIAGTPVHYVWDFGDNDTSHTANPSHVYTQPGTYSVALTAYTTTGCMDTVFRYFPNAIVVHPKPRVTLTSDVSTVSIYAPLVTFRVMGVDPDETFVLWPGDGPLYVNDPLVVHPYADSGSFQATVIVTNTMGCLDTVQIPIRVNPTFNVFVPSAFTPNNDQRNDFFRPIVTGFDTYEVFVMNRWGDVVFTSTDASLDWNGRLHNTGPECPDGIYVWTVYIRDFADSPFEKRGTVTVYR